MTKKQIAQMAVEALKAEYPDAICSLNYTDPLQCLVATRLSAQCTDARVNMRDGAGAVRAVRRRGARQS